MPFPDTMVCNAKNIDSLLPVEIDDEYISDTHVGEQPVGETSLTKGFNILVQIYLCFMVKPQLALNEKQDPNADAAFNNLSTTRSGSLEIFSAEFGTSSATFRLVSRLGNMVTT